MKDAGNECTFWGTQTVGFTFQSPDVKLLFSDH